MHRPSRDGFSPGVRKSVIDVGSAWLTKPVIEYSARRWPMEPPVE
jgi:hypothetical protein